MEWREGVAARLHHSYGDSDAVMLAAAEWHGPDSLTLTWNFAESPFTDSITLSFDGDAIAVDHRSNINSGPMEMARARGSRRS